MLGGYVNTAELVGEIRNVGDRYMSMQANANVIPTFKAELSDLLAKNDIPKEVIDGILRPLDRFAIEPNTSCTTFPYMAGIVVRIIQQYAGRDVAIQDN